MYVIVTKSEELAEEARKKGEEVFKVQDTKESAGLTLLKKMNNKEEAVRALMRRLAFKPNLSGYRYFNDILLKCANDPGYHTRSVTKEIYPECAKKFGTTMQRVERALRTCIEVSYRTVPERYDAIFKVKLKEQPTNSEFISMMSEYLNQYAIL